MPARPAEVYDEWTDAESLREWMCPRPAHAVRVECDARIGGELRFHIRDRGESLVIEGRFLELDRPQRIRFTWNCSAWEPPAPDSVVTVTLEPYGGDETLMTIEHAQLPPDVVDSHERGWETIGEQLGRAITNRP
jgi:uncharacterized protein YndB with AHSA1/START domain